MKLRWPPLWRLLLPATVFLALAVFALITDEPLGYRRYVRMGGAGWRRIPRCASPFDYWSNVVLSEMDQRCPGLSYGKWYHKDDLQPVSIVLST